MTDQSIFGEVTSWLAANFPNDLKSSWYVGIASDINNRLFDDHRVHRINDSWIYKSAMNAAHARSAEAMLIRHGHDGGTGGGDHQSVFVYAFRKAPTTIR